MRWRIRSQLLLPLFLLLLGVAGISVWTAQASARQARRQVEARLRSVARFLSEDPGFPLTLDVLHKMKPLSGADFLLVRADAAPLTSLAEAPAELPPEADVADDWRTLRLGPPLRVHGTTYLCSGIRLWHGPNAGDTLYILYPESLWRDALWEAIWPSVVLGGSLGVASLALAVALARGVSRRIRELGRRTRLIAAGDFSPMPLPGRDDEVRDLARSVNEMAQRLAQFQKTAQQTERLRLLGQVAGGLAHQLRNGLTGVRLAVQLHLREVPDQADRSPLEVALRQLALLEAHIKRFLDLGRAEAPRRESCSLTALAGEAVQLILPQCRHSGIELTWHAPAEPHLVCGDPGQLGQLVLNVLGNAVEAAGPGGKVELRLHDGEPPADDGAPGSVLEVYDTGPGPPPEVAERLFEPFVTGKPEGVGLGLAVARQVAEGHGGRIGWQRLGARTCFRIELPPAAV
jgi:signal transduction histidine kinase